MELPLALNKAREACSPASHISVDVRKILTTLLKDYDSILEEAKKSLITIHRQLLATHVHTCQKRT